MGSDWAQDWMVKVDLVKVDLVKAIVVTVMEGLRHIRSLWTRKPFPHRFRRRFGKLAKTTDNYFHSSDHRHLGYTNSTCCQLAKVSLDQAMEIVLGLVKEILGLAPVRGTRDQDWEILDLVTESSDLVQNHIHILFDHMLCLLRCPDRSRIQQVRCYKHCHTMNHHRSRRTDSIADRLGPVKVTMDLAKETTQVLDY